LAFQQRKAMKVPVNPTTPSPERLERLPDALARQTPQPAPIQHGATPPPHDGRATNTPAKPSRLIRLPTVIDRCGLSRSSIYTGVKNGTFVVPVRLSARLVAWREDEVDRWVSERIKAGTHS
jgi:prophage regulatory protein